MKTAAADATGAAREKYLFADLMPNATKRNCGCVVFSTARREDVQWDLWGVAQKGRAYRDGFELC